MGREPLRKLSENMHVYAFKYYLELTVAFAYKVYKTKPGFGNPGKQMSLQNRWVP